MQVRFGADRTINWYASKNPKSPNEPHLEIEYDDTVISPSTVKTAVEKLTGGQSKFPPGATLILGKDTAHHKSMFGVYGDRKHTTFEIFKTSQDNIPDEEAALKNILFKVGRQMDYYA